jgi:predicted DCC family thiol-disulfide oxidoreductase YuxK
VCKVGMEFADKFDAKDELRFVGMNTEEGKELVRANGLDMNASAYVFRADGEKIEKRKMMVEILSHDGVLGFVLSLPFRVPILGDGLYYLLTVLRFHVTKSRV